MISMNMIMLGQVRQTQGFWGRVDVCTRCIWTTPGSFFKDGKSSKQEWYTPNVAHKAESWNIPKPKQELPESEWRSVFQHFRPTRLGLNVVHAFQKGIDFRPSALKNWFKDLQTNYNITDQSYNQDRVAALGFELAAAHFMVHRKGKIRFRNSVDWVQQDEDGEYELSPHFIPDVYVEAIDATGMDLLYEGLGSMVNLKHLKSLNLSGCQNIDDWCIDRVCAQYWQTLEHLDISHCTKVTENGIAALARLRALKTLNITGFHQLNDIQLVCILLEDSLPDIEIIGVDFMKPPT
ncbi:hypothetical protein Pmani_019994 [Petrolisthes manimaculis]|uniref:ATP synthase subunit s-like protein n=1 Tax=Petrolisthes manimaculis TaxID=1843537 RepID=A0AAE1U315_9EUCA|nr:hypothetical protein Pmani_019994 [Petrolisthes manimaculis]